MAMIIDGTFNMICIHDMYDRKFGRTRAIKVTICGCGCYRGR